MEKDDIINLIVDIDGTICPIKKENENYEDLIPYQDMVNKLREYHNNGSKIILFTSRNMRTYNGDIGKINKHTAPILIKWLEKWNIPYDEIIYGKPWMKNCIYIDDKAIRPSEFILGYTNLVK